MKKTKLFLFTVIYSLVISSVTSNVLATTYVSYPYGYIASTVDVDNYTYLWFNYYTNTVSAMNSWNNCGLTSRSISSSTSSPNKIYQASLPDSWNGIYQPLLYDTRNAQTRRYFTSKFQITLNTRTLDSEEFSDNKDYFIKLAACHELGHALGLDHNDDVTDPPRTIMRSSVYNTVNTPQTYDKNAVNYLWPNW